LLQNISEIDETVIIALLVQQRVETEAENSNNADQEVSNEIDNSLLEITDIDPEWLDEI
jgi:hypothetical protein